MAEVWKSKKYPILFPKKKKNKPPEKIKQKCKAEGHSWSFIATSLAEGTRGTCHSNGTASPSVLSTTVVQTQQFPKLFFKVNAVEMMNEKNTVQRRNYVPFWSQKGTRRRQYRALVWHWWQMRQRPVTTGHKYCPTFGSNRHRGLGWGLKYQDQIKESSWWIFLRPPSCHAPKASQGFAMGDYEGIKSSSYQAMHLSAFQRPPLQHRKI